MHPPQVPHAPLMHAWLAVQVVQIPPFFPQALDAFPALQFPEESQQPPQEPGPQLPVPESEPPAAHALFWHDCPGPHTAQAWPPAPQAVSSVPIWQSPFESQQPSVQFEARHCGLLGVQLGASAARNPRSNPTMKTLPSICATSSRSARKTAGWPSQRGA